MNTPFVKNSILIGIPTVISALGIIMGLNILSNYQNIVIAVTVFLLVVFIIFLFYYSKQERDMKIDMDKMKSSISSMEKILGINSKTVISIVGLLEKWNQDINKIANDIAKTGSANETDWNYEKICTDICISCKDAIVKFTEVNDETDVSVSVIKYYRQGNNEYIKMIAHSSPQTAKPDVYDKEELLGECKYQYARIIRERNRDIFVLEDTDKIKQVFFKKKPETDLSKYSQYIAIPVICSSNKFLGVLQVTTKHNY